MKNRVYSFLVPAIMDASLALAQTAVPLLALRFGASAILLGTIGWLAQVVRLPICFSSGRLSERVGRAAVIVPSAIVVAAAYMALSWSHANTQVLIFYAISMAAIGGFYPPLQAYVGDVSMRGQLTKNLGAFNIGWCGGSAVAAVAAPFIIGIDLGLTFRVSAIGAVIAMILVLTWRGKSVDGHADEVAASQVVSDEPGSLLLIARMGHFTGFFAYGTIRMLFPRLGRFTLGWEEPQVASAVAFLLIGQAAGILIANSSPWWRGKLWPQFASQAVVLLSTVAVATTSSAVIFEAAFLAIGASIAVVYTAALYHGLSGRKDRGKNTGIHEGLVAGGNIAGCFLGGFAAQMISPRAPYVMAACLAGACIIASTVLARRGGFFRGKLEKGER